MTPTKPLHIIHIDASVPSGAPATRLLTEAQGMIARGHRVAIWAAPGSDILSEAARRAIPHLALPIERNGVRAVCALRRALAAARPDVIHTHGATDAWLVAFARLLLRGAPPVVRTLHRYTPIPNSVASYWLWRRVTRHVITLSEDQRETLIRAHRIRDSRVSSIPTIDSERMLIGMEGIYTDVVERYRNRPKSMAARWRRLKRSLDRRRREWQLPRGYVRLGTKYGGWWIDRRALGSQPLLVDCGLGRDISFPAAFLASVGGSVIGIDPNPDSLAYCRAQRLAAMQILDRAFWIRAGETLTFHLPRAKEQLPVGADGVSGSLVDSHGYVTEGDKLTVTTTSLEDVLQRAGRAECDVLKLDIEGAEYEVIADLCDRGLLTKARQLLIEFHHRVTHHALAETEATTRRIEAAGFRLIHVEDRNYIFRRGDLG
jgi:FkbM family methyltransferase